MLLILAALFYPSFNPREIIFSNDNPLGVLNAKWIQPPEGFRGLWLDLNSIGFDGGALAVSPCYLAFWGLGALLYSKFAVPLAAAFVGCAAWLCFRRLKLGPWACLLGGLAACLNSGFFSAACWGVVPQTSAFALDFLAVAVLAGCGSRPRWTTLCLAGVAVGLNVMEAADIAGLFSVMIAAYVMYQALSATEWSWGTAWQGVLRTALVTGFAMLVAAEAIFALVATQIQGVAGMGQDAASKAQRWEAATQWSLPKRETLSLFVPGLFGHRIDTPSGIAHFPEWFEGGVYWGAMGRDGAWQQYLDNDRQGPPPPPGDFYIRHTGGGNYAGVLVVFMAVWAAVQACRKKDSVFPLEQRKLIWFWVGTAIFALMLAWGHYAPFYRIFYSLPYSSTMRNPTKFLEIVDFALVILFAYGIDGLTRRYTQAAQPAVAGRITPPGSWWSRASQFDRRWIAGSVVAVVVSVMAWWAYSWHRAGLEQYLQNVEFDEVTAQSIAAFSIKQAAWFVLLLALIVGLVAWFLAGRFTGDRARWGVALLGLVLVVDLGRANLPWILYWDYKQKYASNEVIDFLRQHPWEQRVAIAPDWVPKLFNLPKEAQQQLADQAGFLGQLYGIEWAQHTFLYYNVQSLDVVQLPRPPADLTAFETAVQFNFRPESLHLFTRRWELTNTRYLLGPAGNLEMLNHLDQGRNRFKIAYEFTVKAKPGVTNATIPEQYTAVARPDGAFAVFEFTGALPRASLYGNWQVSTNDQAALAELASVSFDPARTLLVSSSPLAHPAGDSTNGPAGTVTFKSYAPARIVLEAKARTASVLLFNEKFDPYWKVAVDGKPAKDLRCNYIMQGVEVPPGSHEIEFRFAPPTGPLYISITTEAFALMVLGFLAVTKRKAGPPAAQPPPAAAPARERAPARAPAVK